MTSRFRLLYAFLVLPVVIGGAQGGCKCKKEVVETETVVETVKPEDPLKVVSIEPSWARPNIEQSGMVFGSGFKDGVKVEVGGMDAGAVMRDANTVRIRIPGLAAGEYDVVATNPDGTSSTLRRGYTIKPGIDDCKSFTVNFDFDKENVRTDAAQVLGSKITCLKQAGGINVEGHADERGTTEYNLALGQRRAESVKTYLSNEGITGSKIRTTSYGEERPVDTGHTESAWAKNRRADVTASE